MKYILGDIESTGLKPGWHEITEIAILDCETLELCEWDIKIRHPERCSKEAMMVTNKTPAELISRGRYIEECADEIDDFIRSVSDDPDEIVFIGHSVSYDRTMLEHAWKAMNRRWLVNYYLDTKAMAKKFTKQILGIQKTSHALTNMLALAGIKEAPGAHASIIDVKHTYALYMHMIQRGLKNSEFIKLSPALMQNLSKPTVIKNSSKKIDLDINDIQSSIMDETDNDTGFEDNDD